MNIGLLTPYVAGFLFRDDGAQVALIQKKRPDWQAGKWNAIGGHIEAGETPVRAMVREFEEETGYASPVTDWRLFCTLRHPFRGGLVYFFAATWDEGLGRLEDKTDERVRWHATSNIVVGPTEVISNLRWLIPLALDKSEVVVEADDHSTL